VGLVAREAAAVAAAGRVAGLGVTTRVEVVRAAPWVVAAARQASNATWRHTVASR